MNIDLIIVAGIGAHYSKIISGVASFYSNYARSNMNTRNLSPEERYELVLECRRSGLSDHQWLEEHGIPKSTFYYWISQFRKNGYPDVPKPLHQYSPHKPQVQEVVKVNVLPDAGTLDQYAPSPRRGFEDEPVMEILCGRTVVRLTNNTDPKLLETVLNSLGGAI